MASVADGVRQYLQYLVVERGLAANTVQSYERDLRRYAGFLALAVQAALADVTGLTWPSSAPRCAPGTRSTRRSRSARWAGRSSPCAGCTRSRSGKGSPPTTRPARSRRPRRAKRLPKAIPVDAVERLLDAAGSTEDHDPRVLRDRALLEFLYGTGARISEATGLDVDDLDHLARDPAVLLTARAASSATSPSAATRSRPLDAYLVAGAARPCAAGGRRRPSPAVFLNARGGRLTRQGAWGILREAAIRPGSAVSPPTPCGTPSPPTCSTAAPTSASCRNCSDTPR